MTVMPLRFHTPDPLGAQVDAVSSRARLGRGVIAALVAVILGSGCASTIPPEAAQRFRAFDSDFVASDVDLVRVDTPVHFTAYYSPEYRASRAPTDEFRYPLYGRPADPTHTRTEIEDGQLLRGLEIAWLRDDLDVYLAHVNGSVRLRFDDGTVMCLTHAGTNEHEYTSLGRLLIDAGAAPADTMSMQTIRAIHERNPALVRSLMRRNDRYVYFKRTDCARWPLGGLNVPLTPGVSVAADPKFYSPGEILLVETTETLTGAPYVRLVVVQDVGAAIKGEGRIDLYFGAGEDAGARAGTQNDMGRVWRVVKRE